MAVREQLLQASSLEMPIRCCMWGGGTDKLLAKAREHRSPLRAWSRAECSPQPRHCNLKELRGFSYPVPALGWSLYHGEERGVREECCQQE